jgi:primosomal protein DnaI
MKRISDLVSKVDSQRLREVLTEAFQDNRFVTVVNNLKLTDNQLVENVHLINESIAEKQNCIDCKGLKFCKNEIRGFCQTPIIKHSQFYVDYVECKYNQKDRKSKEHLDYIYSFEVPESLKNADLKDLWTDDTSRFELIKHVSNFLDAYLNKEPYKGAFIYGNNGSGKTHIMAAMINELAKRNIRCGIIYFPELLRTLKANFGTDYDQRYLYIRNLPVLVLDDIGAEKLTEWGRDEILSSILQYRMQANLPTFFTSNLSISNFEKHLADAGHTNDLIKARRIIERIKSMCVNIEVEGKNLRKT